MTSVRLAGLERRRRCRDAEQHEAADRVVGRGADQRLVVADDERERIDARLRSVAGAAISGRPAVTRVVRSWIAGGVRSLTHALRRYWPFCDRS